MLALEGQGDVNEYCSNESRNVTSYRHYCMQHNVRLRGCGWLTSEWDPTVCAVCVLNARSDVRS
jgi:hypothetical protein